MSSYVRFAEDDGHTGGESDLIVDQGMSVDEFEDGPYDDSDMTETSPKHGQPNSLSAIQKILDASNWIRDTGLGFTSLLLLLAVVVFGWWASFIGLHEFAQKHMGLTDHEGWLVPGAYDGGAFALTVSVFRASMKGNSAPTRRLLVVAFTAFSASINYFKIDDTVGRWVSAGLPVLAVIVFEAVLTDARKAYEQRSHKEARLKIHPLRWVFDFKGTKAIVKAHILGQELPEEFAKAAEVVQATKVKRPRSKASVKAKAKATPAPKPAPAAPAEIAPEIEPRHAAPAETVAELTGPLATVVDLNEVRAKYPEKTAACIATYVQYCEQHDLDPFNRGTDHPSWNKIDELAGTNGFAKTKVPQWIRAHAARAVNE